jgi:hypothetical protein
MSVTRETSEVAVMSAVRAYLQRMSEAIDLLPPSLRRMVEDNPNHQPAGSSIGGQFAPAGGGGGDSGKIPTGADMIINSLHGATDEEARGMLVHGDALDTQQLYKQDGTYTPEREALHQQIVQHFCEGAVSQDHPQALFTAGGSASGKSGLAGQSDVESRNLDVPPNAVYINPDDIKPMLDEYDQLQNAGRSDIAAGATHEESSDVAKQLTAVAEANNYNMIIDGTGDSAEGKFEGKIDAATNAGYDTTVRYADVPYDTAIDRESARSEATGRAVGVDNLVNLHQAVASNYVNGIGQMAAPNIEVYNTNTGDTPTLIAQSPAGSTETTVYNPSSYHAFEDKAGGYNGSKNLDNYR